MNIPISQFAKKLEKHVAEIKQLKEGSSKLREHVTAIQTLCELMMEAGDGEGYEKKEFVSSHPVQTPKSMVTAAPVKKKNAMDYDLDDYYQDLDDEDDGNGDSIFDF